MSVIRFGKEELQKLGESIVSLQLHGNFPLRLFKKDEIEDLKKAYKWEDTKCIQQLTEWFMTKLSLANQLCAFYQYHDHKGENEMDFHVFDFKDRNYQVNYSQVYQKITSIEYNMVCNNGNNFTPGFIAEKLQQIKNFLAYKEFHKEV